jgi:hypothetical protein
LAGFHVNASDTTIAFPDRIGQTNHLHCGSPRFKDV